jgi:hypothetical protein
VQSLYENINYINGELNATAIDTGPGMEEYTSLVFWVQHYFETITNTLEIIDNRVEILDSLLSYDVPPSLNIILQAQPCYPRHSVEGIDVRYCNLHKTGIYCELHIVTQTRTSHADLYELINYEGVQLKLSTPETNLILLEDGNWKELTCVHHHLTHTDSEEFQQCDLTTFSATCIEKLHNKNFEEILNNCNFTFATPQEISMTLNGVLLQGDSISSIKEIHPETSKTLGIIKEQTPILISTNAFLEVNTGHRELTIRPSRTYTNRTINQTWLADHEILKLVRLTKLGQVLQSTGHNEIIDIIYGVIFLIIVPAVTYAVKKQCQNGTLFKNCCKKKPKRTNPRKANYKLNKRLLLKDPPIINTYV